MGRSFSCDFCHADVPIEDSLQSIKIGDEVVAELDLTCASTLKQAIKDQKAAASEPAPEPKAPAEPTTPTLPELEAQQAPPAAEDEAAELSFSDTVKDQKAADLKAAAKAAKKEVGK